MPNLIRIRDVLARTGLSRSTMYTLVQQGKFPQSVKLSARCVAWSEADVDNWIAERLAA